MKKYFLFFLVVFVQNIFSQEKYYFDYYTVYEYRTSENDTITKEEITFSNSINPNYHLHINVLNDKTTEAVINDNQNHLTYKLNKFSLTDLNNVKTFSLSDPQKLSMDNCINSKNSFYEVTYNNGKDLNSINIKRFKNKKKTKLINESVFETTPNEITKLQHYNLPFLAISLWCQKFNLNNEALITKCYFIKNGKIINIRTLKEIKKTDFTINTTTN